MPTQLNGRCFWACLFVAIGASARQRWLWKLTPRNSQGYPLNQEDKLREDEQVKTWALSLNQGEIPETIRERIRMSSSAEVEDLDSRQPL